MHLKFTSIRIELKLHDELTMIQTKHTNKQVLLPGSVFWCIKRLNKHRALLY